MKHGKVWGETKPIIITPLVEIHEIKINKGAQCSTHVHKHKWNGFYLLSGKLHIEVWKNEYDLKDITILNPSEFTTVRPGEYHRFWAEEDSTAIEIYYPEPLTEDILRKDVGKK